MIEHTVTHHIQKYIISVLYKQKIARFKELRSPSIDTNLFSYHLKQLLRHDIVRKIDGGYTLGSNGLTYVDRMSDVQQSIRTQPKIVTMLIVQNHDGDILLWKRSKQPYIDTWTFPYGKVHVEDGSILVSAQREASEKLGLSGVRPTHAGDCYIRIKRDDQHVASTLIHIFKLYTDELTMTDYLIWARPHKLHLFELAPAVEQIMTRTFFNDSYFFEEYVVSE